MRFIPGASRPPKEADPSHFVLPAFTQALIAREDDLPVRIYRVGFEPGARMGWHRHDAEQILIGLAGSCVVVNREGERILLEAGDVVVVEPDEEHWHGAPSGAKGEHLAINLGDETTWLD